MKKNIMCISLVLAFIIAGSQPSIASLSIPADYQVSKPDSEK